MLTKAAEVNFLSGPGRDVILIKQGEGDRVLGFLASTGDRDLMTVETSRGAEQTNQHDEVRADRAGREGPGAAAARVVHAGDLPDPGRAAAVGE